MKKKLIILLLSLVLLSACSVLRKQEYFKISDLQSADTTVCMWQTGAYKDIVDKAFPNCKKMYASFTSDLALHVDKGDADCMVIGESYYHFFKDQFKTVVPLDEDIGIIENSIIISKDNLGEKIKNEFNEFLAKCKEDGRLQELKDKWFSIKKDKYIVDRSGLNEKGTPIKIAAPCDEAPYSFMYGEDIYGYEYELSLMFCREYDYYPEYLNITTEQEPTEIQQGKIQMALGGNERSEQRASLVNFSDNTNECRALVCVYKPATKGNFFASIYNSFKASFIDEDRWNDYLKGLGVTGFMSFSAILFGTIIALFLYLANLNNNPYIEKVINVLSTILGRIPNVILIMVLYYIVFANVNFKASIVSSIALTIIFSLNIYSALDVACSSVGIGIFEAGFSLGYSRSETFFKFALPQARSVFISNYKDNVISIILESSVAGFISVMDLTRTGDVIRSNTYEAFFPLIIVALFYFLICTLVIKLLNRLEKVLDPENRSEEDIKKELLK